jgi:DNA-binding MarR family transcriptional regulator
VTTAQGSAATTPEIERALDAFLAFRNGDMDLWRRAGLIAKLSHSSMLALTLILRADAAGEPLRQVAVQTALRISPAGTSAIVSELAERNLVRREADPADRRAFLLVAGDAAPLVTVQLQRHDDEFRELVAEVPAEHLGTLVQVLDGMRELGERKYLEG